MKSMGKKGNVENPYRDREGSSKLGLVHDATSHWLKELNTVFLKPVGRYGTIYKMLYSLKTVLDSSTGKALCAELAKEIPEIKPLKENAARTILDIITKNKHRITSSSIKKTLNKTLRRFFVDGVQLFQGC